MPTDNNDDISNLFNSTAPVELPADIRSGAASIFSLYSSYVEAGFTPAQAMQIIIAMITKR